MDNNNNKREKIIIFILGAVLIIAVLSIIAIFSSAIMRLLGFEYESVGGFILYFIIASIVSYPMNLVAGKITGTHMESLVINPGMGGVLSGCASVQRRFRDDYFLPWVRL